MTEYPEDYPTLSAGPPPVTYSDRVYDYPADPRPSWQTPLAIAGAVLAVIALVVAATAILVRSTVPPDFPPPPPPTTVTSMSTSVSTVTLPPAPPAPPRTSTVVVPVPIPPPPPPQPVSACLQLRNQANIDYQVTVTQATGHWVPQLSSKQPGLVADGITWDCLILAEHNQLRAAYRRTCCGPGTVRTPTTTTTTGSPSRRGPSTPPRGQAVVPGPRS
jgi:serine/threonine-protein kinase